jgi:hypothetical protein
VQYHAYRTEAYRSEGLGSYVRTDVGSRTARLAATRLMSFFLTLLSASLPSSLPQALVTFSANSQYPHPGSRRLALGSTTLLPSTPPPRTEHGPLSPFSASTSCLSSSILLAQRLRLGRRGSSSSQTPQVSESHLLSQAVKRAHIQVPQAHGRVKSQGRGQEQGRQPNQNQRGEEKEQIGFLLGREVLSKL